MGGVRDRDGCTLKASYHLRPARAHAAEQAAAFGGVTTLVDMPLNSIPPTTTVANLKAKTDAAEGQCQVDVAFWGGVVPGNHASRLSLSQRHEL